MARGDHNDRGRGQGRGRGRGGRRGGDMTPEVQISKKLSYLLRHAAEKEGLKLEKGGWILVKDVLENRNIRSLQPRPTFADIRAIVENNDKQRFALIHASDFQKQPSPETTPPEDGDPVIEFADDSITDHSKDNDPSNFYIRANQGHSLAVDSEGLLTPLTINGKLPDTVVHGTSRTAWTLILASGGLKPMSRNHVHFATGVPEGLLPALEAARVDGMVAKQQDENVESLAEDGVMPAKVVSGMRKTTSVLIFLDLRKALESGIQFWLSDNGVVLSTGNDEGSMPLEMFDRVVDRGGKVLLRDGRAVTDGEKEKS